LRDVWLSTSSSSFVFSYFERKKEILSETKCSLSEEKGF
jgi:hypothetical protein